jgi:23S rRNA pseudoU1915 N3-methylase RlmH
MKIKLILVGKTEEEFLENGISMYQKRLVNYISFETCLNSSEVNIRTENIK